MVCLSVFPPIFFFRVSFKTFIIVIMIIVLCSFFSTRTTNNCVVVVFVRFLLLSFTLRAAHTGTQIQHMDIIFDWHISLLNLIALRDIHLISMSLRVSSKAASWQAIWLTDWRQRPVVVVVGMAAEGCRRESRLSICNNNSHSYERSATIWIADAVKIQETHTEIHTHTCADNRHIGPMRCSVG